MIESVHREGNGRTGGQESHAIAPPTMSLPKGGGAIHGMGEKFAANPVTGTGSMTVPIATSPGRAGFGPQLSISYGSGAGNGPFDLGWNLSLPSITRKTDKGLPQYQDGNESDVFILSGAQDLVPVLILTGGEWIREVLPSRTADGRTFLTIAHNKFERSGELVEEKYHTRVALDIEGNQREVIDAKDRVVMRYDYDMLGVRIHQASMEAGERWMLNDVAGQPIYAWDSRNHRFRTAYDRLHRPLDTFLREGNGPERLIARTVYDEIVPDPETNNLRGKPVQLFDQAGG